MSKHEIIRINLHTLSYLHVMFCFFLLETKVKISKTDTGVFRFKNYVAKLTIF